MDRSSLQDNGRGRKTPQTCVDGGGHYAIAVGNDDDYASRSEKIPYGIHSFVIHTLSWRATDIDIWIAKIELELFYTRPGIPAGISNIPG